MSLQRFVGQGCAYSLALRRLTRCAKQDLSMFGHSFTSAFRNRAPTH